MRIKELPDTFVTTFNPDDVMNYEYMTTSASKTYKKLGVVHVCQWSQEQLARACFYIKALEEELKSKDIALANYRQQVKELATLLKENGNA